MKTNIHPTYFSDVQVVCSCGHSFKTGSTKNQITVEVCYKCHPFFTGEQRFVDAKGRVERFEKKKEQAKVYQQTVKAKKTQNKQEKEVKTLKELLGEM